MLHTGGVIQFDLGKATDTGFQRTGSLNRPPTALLTALGQVQADHIMGLSSVSQHISDALQNFPNMCDTFKHQGTENDQLYKTDSPFLHERKRRDNDEPVIHYGTIASSNQVIKHAPIRDFLAREYNALCVEMEAAGLMNDFPCIVIRGICDYSDSHKNKQWQPYAAITAAAYAKELLGYVSSAEVAATDKATKILKSIQKGLDDVHATAEETKSVLDNLKTDSYQERIVHWLSPPDPSVNYNRARKARHPNTGLWLVQGKYLTDWKADSNPLLWLHGMSGCGKTVLSSTIIENLEKNSSSQAVLYFFFDFSDKAKQSLENMLRSLISQLYRQRQETRENLGQSWEACARGGRQPTLELLEATFTRMVRRADGISIILDALDESQTRDDLLKWIQTISEATAVRLLVTSRKEGDIEMALTSLARPDHIISIQRDDVDHDIGIYIRSKIQHDKNLSRWRSRPDVQKKIEMKLMEKANGMFRWAVCQIDALAKCLDYRTLSKALDNVPATLYSTYDRVIEGIPEEYSECAATMLALLTWADRDLSLKEMVDAIAVCPDDEPGFATTNRMPEPRDILRICPSFIELVPRADLGQWYITSQADNNDFDHDDDSDDNDWVRLSHFSVKEYLVSDRVADASKEVSLIESKAKAKIATICLTYLSYIDHNPRNAKELKNEFPFSLYSAMNWTHFARVGETSDPGLLRKILQFLEDRRKSFVTSLRYLDLETGNRLAEIETPHAPQPDPLCYASLKGLATTVGSLLNRNPDLETHGGDVVNAALWAATLQGQQTVAQMLLLKGANPNTPTHQTYGNSLQIASSSGREDLVRLFLEQGGADIDAKGGSEGSALQAAARHGHSKVALTLLNHGADISTQGGDYGHALAAASRKGHFGLVRMLLQKGADVNAQSRETGSALQAAIQGLMTDKDHFVEVVHTLLKHGAIITVPVVKTVFAAGGSRPGPKIVSFLPFLKEASIRQEVMGLVDGVHLKTLLHWSAENGPVDAVEQCLKLKADIFTRDMYGETALHYAVEKGHLEIVKLLVEAGSDRTAVDSHRRTPLICAQGRNPGVRASMSGFPDIVEYLTQLDEEEAHHDAKRRRIGE